MPCIVTIAAGDSTVIIRCEQLAQDPILPANVQLVRCSELTVEADDGKPWDTDLWSIPARQVISYAYGRPHVEPVTEPTPEPEPVPELTQEQQARATRRRAELREADRMLLEMARAKLDAEQASPGPADPTASEPEIKPAPVPRKRVRAKRPGRGQKKPA